MKRRSVPVALALEGTKEEPKNTFETKEFRENIKIIYMVVQHNWKISHDFQEKLEIKFGRQRAFSVILGYSSVVMAISPPTGQSATSSETSENASGALRSKHKASYLTSHVQHFSSKQFQSKTVQNAAKCRSVFSAPRWPGFSQNPTAAIIYSS